MIDVRAPAGRPMAMAGAALRHAGAPLLAPLVAGLLLLAGLILSAPGHLDLEVGGSLPATVAGMHPREVHYGRAIRWTDGNGRLDVPAILGVAPVGLELELAAFMGRHGDSLLLVVDPSETLRHRMGADWDVVWMPLARAHPGGLTLHLRSSSFFAPGDPRRLGVRLDRVTLVNGSLSTVLASLRWWQVLVVVALGGASWRLGTRMADGLLGAPGGSAVIAAGTATLALVGVVLAALRPWLLQSGGLLAIAGALVLGTGLLWLLRPTTDAVSDARTVSQRLATAAAVSSCWLVLAVVAMQYFVDAPRWDIWDVVDLIARMHDGSLRPSDLWRAHNEHRPMTARLLILPNARWFHWNHWIEFGVLMACAASMLLIVARFVAVRQCGAQRIAPAVLLPVALVVCSLTQWENWLRGYHVHIILGAIAPVVALSWLAGQTTSWRRLLLAGAAAVVGVLSFGTGLLAWPIGALALLLRRGPSWRPRLLVWLVAGLVTIVLYRYGLPHRDGFSEVAIPSLFALVRIGAGALVSLAMPIAYVPAAFAGAVSATQVAVVIGAGAAVVLATALIWRHWRADAANEQAWLFPALLVLFGIGAAVLAALGRVAAGLYAMTASRYLVFTACFWVGLMLLLALRDAAQSTAWRRATTGLLLALALGLAAMWPRALPFMAADADGGWHAREELRRGHAAAATVLFPNGLELDRMRQVLERHRLSIYRPQ